jgi:hypothetical protein
MIARTALRHPIDRARHGLSTAAAKLATAALMKTMSQLPVISWIVLA